jgi:putative ribosome biogenesis GTPase RsgA
VIAPATTPALGACAVSARRGKRTTSTASASMLAGHDRLIASPGVSVLKRSDAKSRCSAPRVSLLIRRAA